MLQNENRNIINQLNTDLAIDNWDINWSQYFIKQILFYLLGMICLTTIDFEGSV